MKMRLFQACCLVILGLALKSSPVSARSMLFRDGCIGGYCCGVGEYCYVAGTDTCQSFGCDAIYACGPDLDDAQCDCPGGCIG
jgi:hypothetical protein